MRRDAHPSKQRREPVADFGRRIFGKEVKWLELNPSPKPYASVHRGDPGDIYIRHVTATGERSLPG